MRTKVCLSPLLPHFFTDLFPTTSSFPGCYIPGYWKRISLRVMVIKKKNTHTQRQRKKGVMVWTENPVFSVWRLKPVEDFVKKGESSCRVERVNTYSLESCPKQGIVEAYLLACMKLLQSYKPPVSNTTQTTTLIFCSSAFPVHTILCWK